jgi:LysM repeat protein
MRQFLFVLCFLFSVSIAFAQSDSLFVSVRDSVWIFSRTAVSGESIFLLAKRYYVPPAVLLDVNNLNVADGLQPNRTIYVPLGGYNHIRQEPTDKNVVLPLYRKVSAKDDLAKISRLAGVKPSQIISWNKLTSNTITPGQILLVGWVKYDGRQLPYSNIENTELNTTIVPLQEEKIDVDTLPGAARDYVQQTNNEQNVVEEKGSVVFFSSAGKVKSSDTYFAFHATAPKGTIIKVYNPGTDKTIYVKVLGPIPATKQYVNSILGIGAIAKEALGVTENKAWCELKYAPN